VLTLCVRVFDRDTIRDKYDGNLKQHYDDPAYEVVSLLFRVLTQKKVVTPGSFQSCVVSLPLAPVFAFVGRPRAHARARVRLR
jgi:hypothetical protein